VSGGPGLALQARVAEACAWDDLIRRHEDDPWAYLRRKLLETEPPLRAYKAELLERATAALFKDLERPVLPPGALERHRADFEPLLAPALFADLSFHLDPRTPRDARLEGARGVLAGAKSPTLFDLEALPPERRPKVWEKRVAEMRARLNLPLLEGVAARGLTPERRARLARRLRRLLREYLAVTRSEGGARDEVSPFMLGRLETAVAASLRLLNC
jgi:hypothetical protein